MAFLAPVAAKLSIDGVKSAAKVAVPVIGFGALSSGLGVAAHGVVQDFIGPQDDDHPLRSTGKAPWAQTVPTLTGVAMFGGSAMGYRALGKAKAKAKSVAAVMEMDRNLVVAGLKPAGSGSVQAGSKLARSVGPVAASGRTLGRLGMVAGMVGGLGIAIGASGGGTLISDPLNAARDAIAAKFQMPWIPQVDFSLPDVGQMAQDALTITGEDQKTTRQVEIKPGERHDVLDLTNTTDGSTVKVTESVPFEGATTMNEFLNSGTTNEQMVAEHNQDAHEVVVDALNPGKHKGKG